MKKIMMTLVAAAMATTMSAQLYVGGGLGFGFGKTKTTTPTVLTSDENKTTTFKILPEIGYNLNDNMAIGATIGYVYNKEVVPQDLYDYTTKNNKFQFSPYFRYYFAKWDKVGLFADAQFGIYFGKKSTESYNVEHYTIGGVVYDIPVATTRDYKSLGYSFAIVPGVSYTPCEKISVVAKLGGGLGYWYDQVKTPYNYYGDIKAKSNKFGLDLETIGLDVSVYFNF